MEDPALEQTDTPDRTAALRELTVEHSKAEKNCDGLIAMPIPDAPSRMGTGKSEVKLSMGKGRGVLSQRRCLSLFPTTQVNN